MDRILLPILAIQLSLSLFAPPIGLAGRSIFPADIWIYLWTSALVGREIFGKSSIKAEERIAIGAAFCLFAAVVFHGYWRPDFNSEFAHYIGKSADDSFQVWKEIVVGMRFYCWCVAGFLVSRVELDFARLQRILALNISMASSVMVAIWIHPRLGESFGDIYGYNPTALPWPERIYGVFRSPIEACATLCLGFLLLVKGRWASGPLRGSLFVLFAIAILLTKTLTALIALIAALTYLTLRRFGAKARYTILISASTVAAVCVAVFWNSPYVALKIGNFLFRLKPWALYWDLLTTRWDTFVLGLGFHPHFTDNFYLFVLARGGLLLMATAFIPAIYWYRTQRRSMEAFQKAVILFFAVAGLTVDILAIRPVAYLFICLGIAALRISTRPSETG